MTQRIILNFRCVECGTEVGIETAEELFDLVETQLCAETRKLYCQECIEG